MATQTQLTTQVYIGALRSLGYTFRVNECDNSLEVNGKQLDDLVEGKIRAEMRDLGYNHMEAISDSIKKDALKNSYHPIKNYLNNLPGWDTHKHIADLAGYFVDEHGVFELYLRKWMIGAIAKVFTYAQNPMLVLDSKQKIGKSEFAKWICSPLPNYFIESQINPEDKDHKTALASKWIWEVTELGATIRKADLEQLKAFLTFRDVTFRPPYGRYIIRKPALASFIGTVNNSSGILNDPTGHRRFRICHLMSIDWHGYKDNVNVDQVWAEACEAYLSGESYELDEAQEKQHDSIVENYEVEDPIEGLVKKFFEIDLNSNWWTPTVDILNVLEDPSRGALKGTTFANSRALASTMTKIGLKMERRDNKLGQRVRGYVGIKIY